METFNNVVQNASWEATPYNQSERVGETNYPINIKKKIAEKRRLRRIWQNSRNPRDKTNFNRSAQELKRMIKKVKDVWFNQYTSNLSTNEETNYSLWKATKNLKRPKSFVPPLRKLDGSWARTNQEKSDAFAEHLCEVFKPNPTTLPVNKTIQELLDAPDQLSLPIQPFTSTEVKNTITKDLKPFKASGYDSINGKVLKELPKKAILFLTILFNAILRIGHFPTQWKLSEIIMIGKPGKPPNQTTSYRPISLLPVTSKIFEKLFLKRLLVVIEKNDLIPNHQFGFRQRHSTIEQIHRVVDNIRQDLETKKYCSAVFIDVRQAFDKVWHEGLLYKLKTSLPHMFYNTIKSYLSNRFFRLKFEDTFSNINNIEAGVPQGSVLAPVLYTIFTADLPVQPNVTLATFADDTALLTSNQDPIIASQVLQNALDILSNWLKTWRISINETKSAHITFTLRSATCPQVSLNNINIPQVNQVKYLGMIIDRRLTWKNHIWSKRLHLNSKFRNLYWLLGKHSKLSTENKLLIYKTVLKPVWTYGIQLWGTSSDSNIEIIQRFQSKVIRSILQAPWYVSNNTLHKDTQIPFVKEEISKFSDNYLKRLENHKNYLALNLLDNSSTVYRLKRHNILDLSCRF